VKLGGNEYTFREAAGAFGDLGTLVPFVVGYITINRLDAQSVLFGFGLVGVVSGFYFRTPMPVQPSIGTLLRLFPMPVLGVILFFGGLELASSVASDGFSPAERTVLVVTAGLALWNMGAAYLAGLALHHAWKRRLITL
jgi:hypothetical protein